MGIDMTSFPIRLDAEPVRAIRADRQLWELAELQPPFVAPWGDEPVPDISRALLAAVPEGAGWVELFSGRSFRQAEYLLDPFAYRDPTQTWEQREQTLVYRTIFGAEIFAEHATSGQGFHWRCSTAAYLSAAARRIDELDVAAARRQFSVIEMDDLGVYKVHRDEDDDHAFARILTDLRAFADHARATAASGLDLIITLY
jgi:hypothetical protein